MEKEKIFHQIDHFLDLYYRDGKPAKVKDLSKKKELIEFNSLIDSTLFRELSENFTEEQSDKVLYLLEIMQKNSIGFKKNFSIITYILAFFLLLFLIAFLGDLIFHLT